MATYTKSELVLNKQFDSRTCRHKIDGQTVVLHCHHYASLCTQLAEDCSMLDAKALLAECAEDAILNFLETYYRENRVTDIKNRVNIAEQAFSAFGLGTMQVECAGIESGEITLTHSHIDTGWIQKWGKRETPVNYIGAGYIAGMFSAIFDRSPRSYKVTETQAIVRGASCSRFTVCTR